MKTPALFAAAVLALAAGSALAQVPIDADRDGRISLAEFKSARASLIIAADTDKDGKVSQAELGAMNHGDNVPQAAEPGRVFRILDTDRDGYLSRSEIEFAVDRRFRSLDADGDGYLSKDERQNWKTPGAG